MRADVGEPRHTAPAASPIEGGLRPLDVDAAAAAALAGAVAARDRRRAIALADELYGAALYRFVRGLVGRDDLADDVYQTTLAEAYRDLGELADPAAVRAWLYAIARHRALDALKAARQSKTELMVLITPRLVKPMDPDEVPDLPTDPSQFMREEGTGGAKLEGGTGTVDAPASDRR